MKGKLKVTVNRWLTYYPVRVLRYLLLFLLLGSAIVLTATRVLLASAQDYRLALQGTLSELIELPVQIDRVRAHMQGFNPELIVENIRIPARDINAPPAVEIAQMRLKINLLPLLIGEPLLALSKLTLSGSKLSIVRSRDGSLAIAGLAVDDDFKPPFWLLERGHYTALNSQITWLDEQSGSDPITFQQLDLVLKNATDGADHQLHLLTKLPKKYGKSLRLSAAINGDVIKQEGLTSTVYIEAKKLQLDALISDEFPLGLKLTAGEGSFKQWLHFEHTDLSTLNAKLQAKNLMFEKTQGQAKPFRIKTLDTTLSVLNKADGWQVTVADLALRTETRKWPSASVSFTVDKEFKQLGAAIQQLDLAQLAELTAFFAPLTAQQQRWMQKLHAQGMLKDLALYLDLGHAQYAINGLFERVSVRAVAGFPAINNLAGGIRGSEQSGTVVFATEQGRVFFPDLFQQAFAVERLAGELDWLQTAKKWQLTTEHLVLNNQDFQAEAKALVAIPKNQAAVFIDLQVALSKVENIARLVQYYPASLLDEATAQWLDSALIAGKIKQAKVLLYGAMDAFPFTNNQGVFEAQLGITELDLRYDSEWPHLQQAAAELFLLQDRALANFSQLQTNGLTLQQAVLEIPSLITSEHVLVRGKISGKIIDGLRWLQQTPNRNTVSDVLDAITPSGAATLDLDLALALTDTALARNKLTLHLPQAALTVNAIGLKVTKIKGDLLFTEQGLFGENITAKALGFPLQVKAKSNKLSTLITVNGKTTLPYLQQQFAFLQQGIIKDEQSTEPTAYQLTVDLPANNEQSATLAMRSDLLGITVDLPDSLKKAAKERADLAISIVLNEQSLLPLTLRYQDDLAVAMTIDKAQNKLVAAHIIYGEKPNIAQLTAADKGIKIQFKRDTFDLTKWLLVLEQTSAKQAQTAPVLNQFSLLAKQWQWNDKTYGALDFSLHRSGRQWQGNINATLAKGTFAIPIKRAKNQPLKFNLARLNLSELMQMDFQGEDTAVEQLPLVELVSEQLWWQGHNLGKLQLSSKRLSNGIQFKPLSISTKQHKTELEVDWTQPAQGSTTVMCGLIDSTDFGAFLTQLGVSNDFEESQAELAWSATWQGAPYQPPLDRLQAKLDLHLHGGRLESVEPGLGRILGLFAVEQWVKRLTLDFSDVYKKGMSLNSIIGHFDVAQGKARISVREQISANARCQLLASAQNRTANNYLLVDAVPAQIFITGEANLVEKTLDHTIQVVPKSLDALPVAGTIISGVADVIAQAFISDHKKDYFKEGYFLASHYQVTGNWDDIKVTPLYERDGVVKKAWDGLTDFSWLKFITKK